MLILMRKVSERVRIRVPGVPDIWVSVEEVDRGKIKLGIEAPRSTPIFRKELLDNPSPQFQKGGSRPRSEPTGKD